MVALLSVWTTVSEAKPSKSELALQQLMVLLGGSYDNIAQARAAGDGHPAQRLMIAPVLAPLVGDTVLYVQEMAANDPRRVFTQILYMLSEVPGREQVLLTQLDFKEPVRWRDGHLNRDVFRGMLMQDLRPRAGCDLLWTRSAKGFTAVNSPGSCRGVSRTTGEAVHVEQRMELTADGLSIFDQRRDAAGAVVAEGEADPWSRYARRADAPW
jgi:hypothetical protein